jgi:hypothetical protein
VRARSQSVTDSGGGHEYSARSGQKTKCGGTGIPWDSGGVLGGILGVHPCVGAVSVCIGDPMGFALDPLDPLERGVALELVVHWTRWFISVITSTSERYIRGTS